LVSFFTTAVYEKLNVGLLKKGENVSMLKKLEILKGIKFNSNDFKIKPICRKNKQFEKVGRHDNINKAERRKNAEKYGNFVRDAKRPNLQNMSNQIQKCNVKIANNLKNRCSKAS
jgi:hypothetical protein